MNQTINVAAAGNVLAPALAVLQELGYQVSPVATNAADGQIVLKAEKPGIHLQAEDPLSLLGLAKIIEVRGNQWRPTDGEVDALLKLLG